MSPLERADYGDVGMRPDTGRRIDRLLHPLAGAGRGRLFAGAVVLVARAGAIVEESAYGHRATHSDGHALVEPPPMETRTIFDVASLTKVCATTPALMRLTGEGELGLDLPVGELLPAFSGDGRERITLRHLLAHRSGLWEWWPLYLRARTRQASTLEICRLPLRYPVGEARHYSDLGMMLAGEVVRTVSGRPLDHFLREAIFDPLGMDDTTYNPQPRLRDRIAATSFGDDYERRMLETGEPYPTGQDPGAFDGWRTHTLVGEVADGNAWHAFGGVAGHAGLFSTAADLATLGQMLLDRGRYGDRRILDDSVVAAFTRPGEDPGQGLGF